jgi:integrase
VEAVANEKAGREGGRAAGKLAATLTPIRINSLGPGKHFDGAGHGLYLRVDSNGAKFWIQRLVIHGKRREMGLGSYPLISLAEAREAAMQNKKLAYLGGDPMAERRKAKSSITFAEATSQYLESKLDGFKNEKHRKQWRSTLEGYAFPVLGNMSVKAIGTADVLRVLNPIWKEKNETASRLRGRIENVLSWATVAGHREGGNPAAWGGNLKELLAKPSKLAKGDNQPAVALSDLPQWWRLLLKREGMAARALQFVALTAARSGEVRGATWDEISIPEVEGCDSAIPANQATWTIPPSRMKNGRQHTIPLCAEAVALLRSLPRMEGSPFVFFAPRGGQLSDMTISAVMRRMQEAETAEGREAFLDPVNKRPAVPHGLRSSFRQWAAERGYARDMAEIQLAHFIGSEVERAYQRSDMVGRRRAMLADWAAFLEGRAATGSVVNMRQAREG